jgi:hypothetical protein
MSLIEKWKEKRIKRIENKLKKLSGNSGEEKQQDIQNIEEEDFIPDYPPLSEEECIAAWDKVTKLSEDINEAPWAWNFIGYKDTTQLVPGMIVYVVGQRAPTDEKPYITYKPEPRVISSIHDSGVNGGTVFFTYSHRIEKPQSYTRGKFDFKVVADEDVIYTPLTYDHAKLICRLLNLQSKRLYDKHLLKMQQAQNEQQK